MYGKWNEEYKRLIIVSLWIKNIKNRVRVIEPPKEQITISTKRLAIAIKEEARD